MELLLKKNQERVYPEISRSLSTSIPVTWYFTERCSLLQLSYTKKENEDYSYIDISINSNHHAELIDTSKLSIEESLNF